MPALRLAAVAVLAVAPTLVSGCSDEAKPAPAAAKATPVSDMDIITYLDNHSVAREPQTAADDIPLDVSVRLPAHWSASQAVPGLYLLLQNPRAIDQQFQPNAFVRVVKLTGNFDPKQAVQRGFVDIAAAKDFHEIRESLDDFDTFPSAFIEGTYIEDEQQRKDTKAKLDEEQRRNGQIPAPQQPEGDLQLRVRNRYVIAASGEDKFLVQLQATITDAQAPQLADDLTTLDEGLRLTFKK